MARVLLLGAGAREHALAWAFARSPLVADVVCAPGNLGMSQVGECIAIDPKDPNAVVALAGDIRPDLVVVGPEEPLVAGVVDALTAAGHLAFGPTAAAATLEGSKAWMKDVLMAAEVPTARHRTFTADEEAGALAYLETMPGLYVIKTDGLAAGKGVIVTESLVDARDAVRAYLSGSAFGDAGRTCVIEEGLTGPELSVFVLCDGRDAQPFASAQDHKRAFDGDRGPNTGGMGAYSPVPFVPEELVDEVMERAIWPTLSELQRRGAEYRGVLYCGLMLTPAGPKVIEYNIRFGDPECQVLAPRLESDLYAHCAESAVGKLETPVQMTDDTCVGVYLAADGYPPAPSRTGDVIEGLDAAAKVPGVVLFHAGTRAQGDTVVTNGGRVIMVTATAPTVAAARERAYEATAHISWPGLHYRRDIAAQAVS
jgi:phosphoribosylamine---glycine ligase